jgi:hypothetical protein
VLQLGQQEKEDSAFYGCVGCWDLTKIVSHKTMQILPLINVNADVDADPMTDMHPNARSTWTLHRWTLGEDAKLTRAVTNTPKKKLGKEYKTDWATVAALVPSRTEVQCRDRWRDVLDQGIPVPMPILSVYLPVEYDYHNISRSESEPDNLPRPSPLPLHDR